MDEKTTDGGLVMIGYDEAIDIIIKAGSGTALETETVVLEDIAGRVCAVDIKAPMANQPFDNSAMDGFALNADILAEASNDNPVILNVIGRIAAGEPAPEKIPAFGECYEIMTGAPMPSGCDAVVPVENVKRDQEKALFNNVSIKGDNVRLAGEDFSAGDTILRKGQMLNEHHILMLATLGIGKVEVVKKPKVSVLSTGLEVIDDLETELGAGQIYNSTGPFLRRMLPALGAEVFSCGTVADDPEQFRKKLSCMINHGIDVIVTTGAVSAGAYDFIRQELERAGAKILFHKVKIRPGKPVLFAKFPDGGPLYIGLPGNPVATAAGLRFFVYPLLRAMAGQSPEQPVRAVLKNDYSKKKSDFRFFLRATASLNDMGLQEAEIMPKQQSFMVSPFAETNIWAVAPEGTENMKAGETVNVYPLYPA